MIRAISPADHDAIWAILEPVIRAGETLAIPRDMTRQAALSLWLPLPRPQVSRNKLQLVGCTALLLASKYEEIYAPEVFGRSATDRVAIRTA